MRDLTCEQKKFRHRAGEEEGGQASEPALPVFFRLWQVYAPGEDTFLFYLYKVKLTR